MIKYYCDCCGKETKEGYKFEHYNGMVPIKKDHIMRIFVDKNGNPLSSNKETKELCDNCYNIIIGKALKEFNALKGRIE